MPDPGPPIARPRHPVATWFTLIVVSVFVAEFLIMGLFAWLGLGQDRELVFLLDAALLTLVISPVLYAFSLRPTRRLLDAQAEMLGRVRLASTVFDNAHDGIVVTDAEGRIQQINRAFTTISGYTADDAIGQNPRMLQSGRHDASFYREMWTSIATTGHWTGEIWNRSKDGAVHPESVSISAILDDRGEVTHYAAIFSQAFHDRLTGLPNRHLLMDLLAQALLDAERNQQQLAVVFIDLDGFKAVNDQCGHDAGDEVLQAAARIIRDTVRRSDLAARLGGDEFVLVLRDIKRAEDVVTVLDKVMGQPPTPSARFRSPPAVTYSAGVSLFPLDGTTGTALLRRADEAMYAAKQAGKNAWRRCAPPEAGPADGLPAMLDP